MAKRHQCTRSLELCREIFQAMCRGNGATGRNSTDHSPQVRTSSDSKFAKPHAVGTRLYLSSKVLYSVLTNIDIVSKKCGGIPGLPFIYHHRFKMNLFIFSCQY
ncbi:hypothetical protein AVEN_257324-1 [Araneus ventricosus]|uniref:Uncharacterized protein n=1 Tax=Araneus ventricosus TaxID=182803 RepID=A0A4Y2C8V8_ARAVE|nr:hypothetical protein AVEN_257324-1 [Araneus ventricosus]